MYIISLPTLENNYHKVGFSNAVHECLSQNFDFLLFTTLFYKQVVSHLVSIMVYGTDLLFLGETVHSEPCKKLDQRLNLARLQKSQK